MPLYFVKVFIIKHLYDTFVFTKVFIKESFPLQDVSRLRK